MSTPDKLNRITTRLSSLPSIQLPTDHPRPTSQSINQKVVQASIDAQLNQKCSLAISRLSLLDSDQLDRPSPFHLLLTSFLILLYRYTSETDILIATSSPNPDQPDPLLLRVSLNSDQSFSSLLKSIVSLQAEAEADHVPFDQLLKAIGRNQTNPAESNYAPLFRVRFLEATDPTGHDFLLHQQPLPPVNPYFLRHSHSTYSTTPYSSHPVEYTPYSNNSRPSSSKHPSNLTHALAPSHSLVHYNSPIYPIPVKIYIGQHGPAQSLKSSPEIPINTRQALCDRALRWNNPTSNPKSLERTFTYSQIHHASNVLAHHLLQHGILPEEVVTVYSTRGVDLVIAIMGILKAGATFSVIDPAYPTQRQKIYLEVSKPRGLIILERAGQLSPEVEAYIKSDLSIKVTIPALALQNTGAIKGGPHIRAETGTDVLDDTQHLASQLPSVKIGLDSIGTLSSPRGRLEFQKEFKVVTSV
ncbi:hypothetical protein H4Q26_006043 [Puccinia striiformis f. sp. tritici PST-130]|nr:hypothetical protein H4Q26_006043 [Puccinia striiformis f. sp. tritici PST-130]